MKMDLKKLSSIMLTLLIIGCNTNSPNLSTVNDSNKGAPVSIQVTNNKIPKAITPEEIKELDKEYSFKTKALTKAYLTGKFEKWLSNAIYGPKLIREVAYAAYKHPDLFCEIMTDPANENMLTDIKNVPDVSTRMGVDNDFRDFLDSCGGITYHVNNALPGIGTHDGLTWATAFTGTTALQQALDVAVSGDKIWIAAGTYKPTALNPILPPGGGSRSATFALKPGVKIYGGFVGDETSISARSSDNNIGNKFLDNEVILDGDIGTPGDNTDNSHHVVFGFGVNDFILDGITVKNGNANDPAVLGATFGGGMLVLSSTSAINNVTFSNNSAMVGGGGLTDIRNTPFTLPVPILTLNSVAFTNNNAYTTSINGGNGGGMLAVSSTPTLNNVDFSNNTASTTATSGGDGGGMFNNAASPTLNNVTFYNNTASSTAANGGFGGGLFNILSSPVLNNVIFDSNQSSALGGGIANMASSPTLTNVVLSENNAPTGGGMINSGTDVGNNNFVLTNATMTNVIFSNNTATQSGGGMANQQTGLLTLTNTTFFGNSATNGGGGMLNIDIDEAASIIIKNSIFWGNTANTGKSICKCGASDDYTLKIGYSDIEGGFASIGSVGNIYNLNDILLTDLTFLSGGFNKDEDPLFSDSDHPAGSDGIFMNNGDGLLLGSLSPAKDAGANNTLIPVPPTPDKDIRDVTRPQGAGIDMGAYEQ